MFDYVDGFVLYEGCVFGEVFFCCFVFEVVGGVGEEV